MFTPAAERLNNVLTNLGMPVHNEEMWKERGEPRHSPDRLWHFDEFHGEEAMEKTQKGVKSHWTSVFDFHDYALFKLDMYRFNPPVYLTPQYKHIDLFRLQLTLVEGEDALDTDEFQFLGHQWEVLRIELPYLEEAELDVMTAWLLPFLENFDVSHYYLFEEE